jgi:hypothetical protein
MANTQAKQNQSIFPDFPREAPAVDKQGNFTDLWNLGLGTLFQALQDNFKNEGILFPSLSAADIATIQSIYAPYIGQPLPIGTVPGTPSLPDISGQTVFDKDNRVSWQFVITYDSSSPPLILTAQWRQLAYV